MIKLGKVWWVYGATNQILTKLVYGRNECRVDLLSAQVRLQYLRLVQGDWDLEQQHPCPVPTDPPRVSDRPGSPHVTMTGT